MVARWPTSTDLQRLTKSYFYWDWRLRSPFYNENIVWENSIRYRMNENSTDEFNSPLLSSRGSAFWYRIYGLRTRLSAKSLSSVWGIKCSGRETSENSWKSHSGRAKKKKTFCERGITWSDGGKGEKSNAALFDSCKKLPQWSRSNLPPVPKARLESIVPA